MKELLELSQKSEGWCPFEKMLTLFNLTVATRPITIVEIGVFAGRSAIPMMMACKFNGRGMVHCVDPWSNQASLEGQIGELHQEYWGRIDHEEIYQKFVIQVSDMGLKKFCQVHRMKSSEFNPPTMIDLLHIDGNHGEDALKDTIKFASRVPSGGYCCLDDLGWVGGFVGKSAEWLKANGFVELHPLGTGALFYKL